VNWTWGKNADGFTLLEVMVALSIIAFAVVTYVHSQNTSVVLLNEASNVTVATLLAQGRMVVLEGSDISGPVEREGIFDDPEYRSFRWKERVVSTPLPNMLEAHVEVSWDDGRGRRTVDLLSLVISK
jgi:general secretion pathway protein I